MKFSIFCNYLVRLFITLLMFRIGQLIKSPRFLSLKEKLPKCYEADDMHINNGFFNIIIE